MSETIIPTQSQLEVLSAINLSHIEDDFISQAISQERFIDKEAALSAINDSEQTIRNHHALTVNMSAASILRLRQVGKLETYWGYADQTTQSPSIATGNNKAHHDRYQEYRKLAEDSLRPYAPPEVQNNHPVYAALAGPTELKVRTGAAPEYGNWHVVLTEDVAQRAVYHFADSHAAIEVTDKGELTFDKSAILAYGDVFRAKAVADMAREHNQSLTIGMIGGLGIVSKMNAERFIKPNGKSPGYIEAAIFDEISLEKISAVVGKLRTPQELAAAAPILLDPGTLKDKIHLQIGDEVEPFVAKWLARHFPGSVPPENLEDIDTALFASFGLTPESTYEEVARTLDEQAAARWPKIATLMYGYGNHGQLTNFQDERQWHNYLVGIRQKMRRLDDTQRREIKDFIAIQQARVFFRTNLVQAQQE